jgi:hypothetical protein
MKTIGGLISNFNTTSSNAAEHANSALREMSGMPILSRAINHLEHNMKSLQNLREKHTHLLNDSTRVSPRLTKKVVAICIELQAGLWEQSSLSSFSNNGYAGVLYQARHKDRTKLELYVRSFQTPPGRVELTARRVGII